MAIKDRKTSHAEHACTMLQCVSLSVRAICREQGEADTKEEGWSEQDVHHRKKGNM